MITSEGDILETNGCGGDVERALYDMPWYVCFERKGQRMKSADYEEFKRVLFGHNEEVDHEEG